MMSYYADDAVAMTHTTIYQEVAEDVAICYIRHCNTNINVRTLQVLDNVLTKNTKILKMIFEGVMMDASDPYFLIGYNLSKAFTANYTDCDSYKEMIDKASLSIMYLFQNPMSHLSEKKIREKAHNEMSSMLGSLKKYEASMLSSSANKVCKNITPLHVLQVAKIILKRLLTLTRTRIATSYPPWKTMHFLTVLDDSCKHVLSNTNFGQSRLYNHLIVEINKLMMYSLIDVCDKKLNIDELYKDYYEDNSDLSGTMYERAEWLMRLVVGVCTRAIIGPDVEAIDIGLLPIDEHVPCLIGHNEVPVEKFEIKFDPVNIWARDRCLYTRTLMRRELMKSFKNLPSRAIFAADILINDFSYSHFWGQVRTPSYDTEHTMEHLLFNNEMELLKKSFTVLSNPVLRGTAQLDPVKAGSLNDLVQKTVKSIMYIVCPGTIPPTVRFEIDGTITEMWEKNNAFVSHKYLSVKVMRKKKKLPKNDSDKQAAASSSGSEP